MFRHTDDVVLQWKTKNIAPGTTMALEIMEYARALARA